jgi:hypothetical protein
MKTTVLAILFVAVVAVFSASGCSSKDRPVAGAHSVGCRGFASWADPVGYDPATRAPFPARIPGIGIGNVSGGTWNDDKVFVVWGDQTGGSVAAGGLGGSKNPNLRYRCEFGGVTCECETADGKTGTCWIGLRDFHGVRTAGTSYSLADGGFFLLSTQGEQPRVKQLKRDLTTLKDEAEFFKGLAKSDAEIRAFFLEPEKAK